MTNWLKIFLAFYILVGQPALLWWMLNNCSLYQLAWVNAWVFVIARLISALCKPNKPQAPKDNTAKVIEKSEEKISRIENDNGVAVVSVEKKQEVVVETAKSEESQPIAEWLVENDEEKSEETIAENLEEKTEEKIPERPMRESVTIPKIVQPLSWHQTPKKRKKDLKWWQWLVLFLTLWVAAIIAWTLWEFLWNRWIAIALFLWWILYLVIGKLFDIDGFYNAKKLFTNWLYIILILAWIGYGVYATQNDNSFNLIKENAVSYIKDWFNSDKTDDSETNTWDVIYVFEWTGEVITDTWDVILDSTWDIETQTWITENTVWIDETNTWIIETTVSVVDVQPEAVTPEPAVEPEPVVEPTSSSDDPNREVTRWEAIKHLLQWYTLSKKTDKSSTYVAKSNELYPYFKTAQEKAMIWTDVNPNKRISCETYMSLKWILEWWKVNIYDKSQTRIIYWNKAYELGKTNGCGRWWFVKVKNL